MLISRKDAEVEWGSWSGRLFCPVGKCDVPSSTRDLSFIPTSTVYYFLSCQQPTAPTTLPLQVFPCIKSGLRYTYLYEVQAWMLQNPLCYFRAHPWLRYRWVDNLVTDPSTPGMSLGANRGGDETWFMAISLSKSITLRHATPFWQQAFLSSRVSGVMLTIYNSCLYPAQLHWNESFGNHRSQRWAEGFTSQPSHTARSRPITWLAAYHFNFMWLPVFLSEGRKPLRIFEKKRNPIVNRFLTVANSSPPYLDQHPPT